jgi:hypothetical protein
MINNAVDISRRTFLKYIDKEDLKELELNLSYSTHPKKGLTMAGDYAVSYRRSKLHEKRVYFFNHSMIEYVFIKEN